MGGSLLCLDHCLNRLWHTFHQVIPSIVFKVISNTDNHFLDHLLRYNMSTFIRNYMFDICLNVLNWIEIITIWGILMMPHSKLLSDKNGQLFMRRSIIFYDNSYFHLSKHLVPELLQQSFENLVLINGGVHLLSSMQLKKHIRFHLTPSKYPQNIIPVPVVYFL